MSEKLYRVEVERRARAVFYVQAPDRDAAVEDADGLACELEGDEWDTDEDDVTVSETTKVLSYESDTWVWVGGAGGKSVPAASWKAPS